MKKWLIGNTLKDIEIIVNELSLPKFTAKQICDWIYNKRVKSIDQMSNLSQKTRDLLSESYTVGGFEYTQESISTDGTKKYLFPSLCSTPIESVMIPDNDRATLCISSQAGCKMGCKFCMTARMGFNGNLSSGEIVSQLFNIPDYNKITNIVYMGMGEPLDNFENVIKSTQILTESWGLGWSPKRITVSSIGVLPKLRDFLEISKCHLAISLHNPFEDQREDIMPMQKAWNLSDIIEIIKEYDFTGQRRVSFEYIMFSGYNDTKKHADSLIRMLRGLECRVNLIRFHKIPDFDLSPSPDIILNNFRDRLNNSGITATIRASRGEDILAACGMLSSTNKRDRR